MSVKAADYASEIIGDNFAYAIKAAMASLGVYGGVVDIGRDLYNISPPDTGSGAVLIDRPVTLRGDSSIYTGLKPEGMGANKHPIVIKPRVDMNCHGITLEGFHIADVNTGHRGGDTAILIVTTASGEYVSGLAIRDICVGEGANWAIHHVNNHQLLANGGMWCSVIERVSLKNGIFLEGSGDSISMRDLTISRQGTGIRVDLVEGATGPFVQNANITSYGCAIRHIRGHRFSYRDLNIEHVYGQPDRGCVVDIGGPAPIQGGEIRNALVSNFGLSQAYGLIRLENCHGTVLDGITLLSGFPSCFGIDIMPSCTGIKIGSITHGGNVVPVRDFASGTTYFGGPFTQL